MVDDKEKPESEKPFSEQIIDTIVDGAAVLTKSAAKSAVDRIAKKVTRTKPGKAVASAAKKVKQAAAKKKVAPKRTVKKLKKKTAKKTASKVSRKKRL